MEENYVYRKYQTMSSGTLTPVKYYRKVTPGQRKASKEEREAFTTAAAAKYAEVNGIEVAAVKRDKVTVMGAGRLGVKRYSNVDSAQTARELTKAPARGSNDLSSKNAS